MSEIRRECRYCHQPLLRYAERTLPGGRRIWLWRHPTRYDALYCHSLILDEKYLDMIEPVCTQFIAGAAGKT